MPQHSYLVKTTTKRQVVPEMSFSFMDGSHTYIFINFFPNVLPQTLPPFSTVPPVLSYHDPWENIYLCQNLKKILDSKNLLAVVKCIDQQQKVNICFSIYLANIYKASSFLVLQSDYYTSPCSKIWPIQRRNDTKPTVITHHFFPSYVQLPGEHDSQWLSVFLLQTPHVFLLQPLSHYQWVTHIPEKVGSSGPQFLLCLSESHNSSSAKCG